MKEILLTFEWDGKNVHKEAIGYTDGTGKSCTEETRFIDEALGKAKNKRYKAEYYATESVKQSKRLRTSN